MSRFNTVDKRARTVGPIISESTPSGLTGNQAPGFARDTKSELFLLAVNNFVGQNTFYETGPKRDERFALLIRQAAVADPAWMARFLPWLRNEANMRTASIVGALEASVAMIAAGIPGSRQLVNSVLQRADEPGEALAYAKNLLGGISKPVKRGVGDAVRRMYNEYTMLKYDTDSHAFRFGDVLEICHPKPSSLEQISLFRYAISRRHNRPDSVLSELPMIHANKVLREQAAKDPRVLLNPTRLKMAGMTWEDVLSLAGSKVDKRHLWESVIPTMGYMALLRNLRNFDECMVDNLAGSEIAKKLSNPHEVARSRQLPMRFLSAYRASSNSLRWGYALEQALDWSLQGIPHFPGRTLILIDTSGSMHHPFSKDGTLMRWDSAVLFGLAMSRRCDSADVVSFSNSTSMFRPIAGESLLKSVARWKDTGFFLNGGTATATAVRNHFKGHDRLVVLTDEQADAHDSRHVFDGIPESTMTITFNLAGSKYGHAPTGTRNRATIAGLNDSCFNLIPALEGHAAGSWPF